MSYWQQLPTQPLAIDAEVPPARAQAITAALARRIVPLLARRDGRFEPLASGCLYTAGPRLLLLTCRHVFDDGATLGDLAVPVAAEGRLLELRQARARLLAHPVHDLAVIEIGAGAVRHTLCQHWQPVPFSATPSAGATQYVLAGYPYVQMRRLEGALYARPVVIFAPPLAHDGLRLRYGRIARRIDGQWVHAPALDGVSGATLWAVTQAHGELDCVLQPAGIQCAFFPGRYARGEPMAAVGELLARMQT